MHLLLAQCAFCRRVLCPFAPSYICPLRAEGAKKFPPSPPLTAARKFSFSLWLHTGGGASCPFLGGREKGKRGKDGTREKNSIHMEEEEVVFFGQVGGTGEGLPENTI